MDQNKTIQLLLKFGLDQESKVTKTAADLGDLAKKFEKLQSEADSARKAIKDALTQDKPADELRQKLVSINKEMSQTAAKAVELQRRISSARWESIEKLGTNLQNVGDKIGQIGGTLTMTGAALTGPILAAAQNFVNNSPMDEVAIRWLDAQGDIEDSFLRIGKVAADQLLPFLEKAADMAEDMAGFVEKNPELIKALVGLGGGLIAGGTILQGGSAIAKTVGAGAELLGKGGLAAGGAGAAGAGAAAGGGALAIGGVALAGLGLGLGGYEALAQSQTGKNAGLANLGQYASVAAYGAGKLFDEETAQRWFQAMGEMTGVIEKQADAAQDYSKNIVTKDMLSAFDAWEKASKDIEAFEKESAAAREDIVAQAGAQRVEIERRFEESRTKTTESYLLARTEAENDYYRSRSNVARRYGVEVQRAEQDHQRRMRQLQDSHNQRLQGLVDDRDAFGIMREIGSYESQRREEEQSHQIEMRRKSEDFAAELALMERNFQVQQERRAQQYERQVAEIDARQVAEVERLQAQTEEKLKLLDEQNKKELDALKKNEQNRYAMLRSVALNDNSILQSETANMTARYKAWLEAASRNLSLPPTIGSYNAPPGRANGGYAWDGIYRLGERGTEYVMDDGLTKTAERALGGPVTKYGLTDALMGRGGRGSATAGGNSSVNMRIETQSLTLGQVVSEIDSRLARNNHNLSRALGG